MKRISIAILTLSLSIAVVPFSAFAANLQTLLPTQGSTVVSRGDFIRAAIEVLELTKLTVDERHELPYVRVPSSLEKYIRIADKKNALEVFGYDLQLARGITRGQALRVLANLTGFDTATPAGSFTDVQIGTPDERAVRIAIDREWMEPLRSTYFGVRRMLTGDDARLLLRRVAGEEEVQDRTFEDNSQTITVNFQSNVRINNLPKTQILEAIWGLVQREFLYTDDIDVDEAAYKAAEGLIESLGDKYTTFMRPVKSRQFQTQLQGEVTGIGAQVEDIEGVVTVVSPIKGSPAEAAGIQPGDQILAVNGTSLTGLSFLEAVEHIRGPKGSVAKLTIRRNGTEVVINVSRDVVRVPEAIVSWQGDVVLVEIMQFGQVTQDDLRPGIEKVIGSKTPSGIIIDLRNNPGGLLHTADTVMSIFVPKGTKVAEIRSRSETRYENTALEQIVPDEIPVVVLVNEGSASASEIVAGALQDHRRATVIGTNTFGKGTVQQVVQFNDQSSLKMTIAEWFTPNGRKIDGVGIEPDIIVEPSADRDEVMIRALEVLR